MVAKNSVTSRSVSRRGSVLPILAVTLTAMVGFVALAVDLGMLAIAKAQTQNAADLAALTAARTLSGDASINYNQSTATANAQAVLGYNQILGQTIQTSQLQLTYGSYDYNQTTQTFNANFPATSGMPYSAVTATVTSSNSSTAFGAVFGIQFFPNVTATATAVHRPRDIALVMDLSGSMRLGTCLGFDPFKPSRTTNNPDSVYPTFGHYSSASSSLQGPSTNQTSSLDSYTISPSNTTVTNTSYTLTYVNGFYQNAAYASTLVRAFDSYTSTDGGNTWSVPAAGALPQLPPSTYTATPGGDVPLFKSGSTTTYAATVKDVVGSSSTNTFWELDGYSAYVGGQLDKSGSGGFPKVWTQSDYSSQPFYGYTQGPGYYGMTFFIWPPDPRAGAITTGATLKKYLSLIGLSNATDQTTLASNWSSWSLSQLQSWLQGATTKGGPYKPTGPFVSGSSNQAPIYYAVCRLYNRGYPAGSANGAFTADWRQRFFGTNDNTVLFNGSGQLNAPGSYTINYSAILSWISQTLNSSGQQANPFPQQMRAGRVKYYASIPTQITGSWPSYGSTDQRFWKEVIDYSLGFIQTGSSSYQDVSAIAGYGSDFKWGSATVSSPPAAPQYMSYTDTPYRPLLRYWFGPINMVDYLHNYNMEGYSNYYWKTAGDSYEAPTYAAKQAYLAAVTTMQNNHPNDWFTTICYSSPRSSSNSSGRFNCVRSPLGPNYTYAQSALVFPFSTINSDGSANNTEITPYDADPSTSSIPSSDFGDTPRPDGNTCFAMSLMLAYNQFATTSPSDSTLRSYASSTPIAFPSGMAGGMGRKGAQKVIIFETDGLANTNATATLVNAGTYNYYKLRYDMNKPTSSEYPSVSVLGINNSTVLNQVYSIVQQLASDYGTSRNPFRLYAIGFGPVFNGPDASSALQTLQTMQYYAGTQSSASTSLTSYQIITGTGDQMTANMITAFTNILENGVQISLIK